MDRLLEPLPFVPRSPHPLTACKIHKVKLGGHPVVVVVADWVTLAGGRLFSTEGGSSRALPLGTETGGGGGGGWAKQLNMVCKWREERRGC